MYVDNDLVTSENNCLKQVQELPFGIITVLGRHNYRWRPASSRIAIDAAHTPYYYVRTNMSYCACIAL